MSADNPYHSISENLVSLKVAHKEHNDLELNKNCYYPGCLSVSILFNAHCCAHVDLQKQPYNMNVLLHAWRNTNRKEYVRGFCTTTI